MARIDVSFANRKSYLFILQQFHSFPKMTNLRVLQFYSKILRGLIFVDGEMIIAW